MGVYIYIYIEHNDDIIPLMWWILYFVYRPAMEKCCHHYSIYPI